MPGICSSQLFAAVVPLEVICTLKPCRLLFAAQYLELHPNATAAEVRRALVQEMATPDIVTGGGPASPTMLLYTNLNKTSTQPAGVGSGGGSISQPAGSVGSSKGATVVIVVSVVAAVGKCRNGPPCSLQMCYYPQSCCLQGAANK